MDKNTVFFYRIILLFLFALLPQEDLIDVMPAVEEANSISEELDKRVKFEIILIRFVFLCEIVLEFLYIEIHGNFFIVEEVNLILKFHLLSPHMLGKMQGTTKAKVEVMLLCSYFKPSLDPYPEPWTRNYNIIIKYLILTGKYNHCQLFN